MSEQYEPPFTMNEEITTLVIEIGELVGHLTLTETLWIWTYPNAANTAGESTVFVEFMLNIIKAALIEFKTEEDVGVNVGTNEKKFFYCWGMILN